MSDRMIVEQLIRKIFQSPDDFYRSQWQKDGETAAEHFNEDVYRAVSRIYKKLPNEAKEALFVCVPRERSRVEEFDRVNKALQNRFDDYDLAKAVLLYYIYLTAMSG